MKRTINLFNDLNRASLSTGVSQVYLHEESLCDVLGSADALLLHFFGSYRAPRSS